MNTQSHKFLMEHSIEMARERMFLKEQGLESPLIKQMGRMVADEMNIPFSVGWDIAQNMLFDYLCRLHIGRIQQRVTNETD